MLWLAFHHDRPALQQVMTWVFALFAHVRWLVYMWVAVPQTEPEPRLSLDLAGDRRGRRGGEPVAAAQQRPLAGPLPVWLADTWSTRTMEPVLLRLRLCLGLW